MEGFKRVVHQIWYNFKEWGQVEMLPVKYELIRQEWQVKNPGWEFVLWNEQTSADFLNKTFSPAVYKKFMSYKLPIQRADFFRWVVLYYFGGCYIDTDCTPLKPLDTLLERHLKTPKDVLVVPDSAWATNAMIVATPRHPAIAKLIDQMPIEPSFAAFVGLESVAGVFFTTGPAIVRAKLLTQPNVVFDPDMMWHVPGQPGPVPADRTFVAQHFGDGSWNFQTLLVFDIARLVIAIILFVLATILVIYLITQFIIRHRSPSHPHPIHEWRIDHRS
jgi:mannosyltransferase OCH1-like enzyme